MEKERSPHVMTAALASAGILAETAHADTLTVCAYGCNYSSIKDAIDGVGDGDLIQVEQGAYYENELNTDGKPSRSSSRGASDRPRSGATVPAG